MLDSRAKDRECLDGPVVSPELARWSYRLMAGVNRWLGGTRVVKQFVADEFRRRGRTSPLRLLDIGCGTADIPFALQRWASRRGMPLEIVALERCPEAVTLARRRIGNGSHAGIELRCEDVLTHCPSRHYDIAVGSMFFHHLDDIAILGLVRRLKAIVRGRLLINDLCRSYAHWLGGALLTLPLRSDVRHDALLSIRRGFRAHELRALLQGTTEDLQVSTRHRWLFRVVAIVDLHPGAPP